MPEHHDATKDMYLSDITDRDIDNLGLVMKECKEHLFNTPKQAGHFMGVAVNGALKKLGINQVEMAARVPKGASKDLHTRLVDKAMVEKNVKVERRRYKEREDIWRSGIYIYHNNEISYFISEAMRVRDKKGASAIIIPGKPKTKIMVLTNYKE